ncbi:protein-L-isoaspartate(D-aspartate) O-methyltransferase [Methanococcoides vulcani]|uniref:Protein-L-isoaspartate O-methyltransferase n=2 Tax=Methanococcoides vulcani TaxID=1353158 RepID=A0A1I0BTU9_9EURY|nr:protein-L-isoaspartate O-methyltransferase [Methanococcoides vulcani]SET10561.1 protein-L-isoaspartate(D-aspartate) O-methyltransferase [Methanococcoides vulcani]
MEFEERRKILIDSLKINGISDRVLDAMMRVPRHLFVPEKLQDSAYMDMPLPIGHDQTISAPHMVAIMCELLDISSGMKILEVGSGSGYNAAVMAELVGDEGHIYTVERIPGLADFAERNLKRAGYKNITVLQDDGSCGLAEHAPYARISVTSAAPDVPQPLIDQLATEGTMVIPVGNGEQQLVVVRKDIEGNVSYEVWGGVIFVPLIGKYGY